MDKTEIRILENQRQIMWTLHYLLKCAAPDLVGKGGELDAMRDDLAAAAKETNATLNQS